MNLKNHILSDRKMARSIAESLGVPTVLIYQWANGVRRVPVERAIAIDLITDGEVSVEEMRPDIEWAHLRKNKKRRD